MPGAKKFALRAQNTPDSAFLRLRAEFFRGTAVVGAVLGEFFAPTDIAPGVSDPRVVQFPHRVAVRSRLEVVRHPKCRPARRKVLKTGRCGRGGLRLEHVASDMAHMRRCPGIE